MFLSVVNGRGSDYLLECYYALCGLLSKCLNQKVGVGFDIVGLRSDIPVPAAYARALLKLSREMHRLGGKFRFRVKKNRSSGFMIKDYVDLLQRVVHNLFPLVVCNKRVSSLLRVEKPRKIDITKPGEKRVQKYTYTYRWNQNHIQTLLYNAIDAGHVNDSEIVRKPKLISGV